MIELGPGDGSLSKVLIEHLKNFQNLIQQLNYLYEKSNLLIKTQKKKLMEKIFIG